MHLAAHHYKRPILTELYRCRPELVMVTDGQPARLPIHFASTKDAYTHLKSLAPGSQHKPDANGVTACRIAKLKKFGVDDDDDDPQSDDDDHARSDNDAEPADYHDGVQDEIEPSTGDGRSGKDHYAASGLRS